VPKCEHPEVAGMLSDHNILKFGRYLSTDVTYLDGLYSERIE
jgi:hypothetical protein